MSIHRQRISFAVFSAIFALAMPTAAFAQATPTLNGADTAWIITATALVLFMTMPGLALFYGGLVRSRNLLSVLMHCSAICCVNLWRTFAGFNDILLLVCFGLYCSRVQVGSSFLAGLGFFLLISRFDHWFTSPYMSVKTQALCPGVLR